MTETPWLSKAREPGGERERRDETYQADPEELLLLYRRRSGWSQEELAQRLDGVSSRSIRNWEAGVTQPKPETLSRLIEVYCAAGVFLSDREIDEARHLWQRVKSRFDGQTKRLQTYPLFDEARFTLGLGDRVAKPLSGTVGRAGVGRPWKPALLTSLLATAPAIHRTRLAHRPGNLPLLQSSLLERKQEVESIREALSRTRLLTLIGPGGVGKTTLTLMAATTTQEEFPDGVWFVDLAPLTQPDAPIHAAAQVLGFPEEADRPLIQTLVSRLREKHLLLLLDNCEHLLDGCAALVTLLLQTCPQVKILASSREAIRTHDEVEWRVSPLSVPAAPGTPEDLLQYESVALFLQRAQNVRPTFAVTEANAAAVADVCRRLDGIPLAIELAAARLSSFTIEHLALFLENGLTLLSGGNRDDRPRHRTMQGSIQWSYDLLHESERQLWRRLSVFTGGWTLAAAEAVCAGDATDPQADIPQTLAALVDKSIVLPVKEHGEMRYRLLETLRQFGQVRLVEAQEDLRLEDRHLAYFTAFAEQAAVDLLGANAPLVVSQVEADWPNLSAALRWSADADVGAEVAAEEGGERLAMRGRVADGLRLAVSLNDFWRTRHYVSEARALLDPLIEVARQVGLTETSEFAPSLIVAGWLAQAQNDFSQAQLYLREALSRFEAVDDVGGIGIALAGLGFTALEQGNVPLAETYLARSIEMYGQTEEAVNLAGILFMAGATACYAGDFETASARLETCFRLSHDAGAQVHVARALFAQGVVAVYRGEAKAARRLLDKAIAISGEADNSRLTAYALNHTGFLAAESGDARTALKEYQESLYLWRGVGMKMGLAFALAGLADWLARFGTSEAGDTAAEQSALLCGTVTELLRSLDAALPPLHHQMLVRAGERARARLGEGMFHAAFIEGQVSPLDAMVELALSLRPVGAEGADRTAAMG